MSSVSIFISYSHKDEEWKDRIVMHLRVLEMEGMLDVWDDRRIEAGDDWREKIDSAINTASIAILIISANFLTSKFILDEEVPKLLERRMKEGVRVIPVITKPCAWTQVKWLSQIQARPKDGKPLSTGNEHQINNDLSDLTNEIAGIIKRAGIIPDPKKFIPLPPDKISLAKLPSTSPDLFGRDNLLKELDKAWENPHINIFTLVAWGGVGKSALVNKWLSHMAKENYRGADRVFGWSFYSQGAAEGRQVSADQFIASALVWLGDPDPNVGSAWDKGERLAELVKQSRTLFILDGLEPLQTPPPVETGLIKDPALAAFLREMARQNPGLVLVTTRLAVDNLKDCVGDTVIQYSLDNLSPKAAAAYLKYLGVDGTDVERQVAAREFGGHALALTLMGRYLVDVFEGDVRKRNLIPHLSDEEEKGGHAKRIMRAYEKWFVGKPEHDLLILMGLFDRPVDKGALDALIAVPVIDGLTNQIQNLSIRNYKLVLKHLRKARILTEQDPRQPDALDCHPLLREHFGEQLKEANPVAWREGNNRLYEYYKSSVKEFPDTLQEMSLLFAAVMHGCQAGRYQEAFDREYEQRIRRGNEAYNLRKLGAHSATLVALSYFFETPWSKPITSIIDEKAVIPAHSGFCLRALGRTVEAAEAIKAALDANIAIKQWLNASRNGSNLSELYEITGELDMALRFAKQSVELADYSQDAFMQWYNRTTLGDVLHQLGRLSEAEDNFREAEKIQNEREPGFPFLYSLQGFRYCDLLLSQGRYQDVQTRVVQTLQYSKQHGMSFLTIGLDHLSLGRVYFLQAQKKEIGFIQSANELDYAVENLLQAGTQHHIPRSLIARAEFFRVTGSLDKAQRDLDEALSIATRGGMGLFLADCHLEYARLHLVKEEKDKAKKNWKTAKEEIDKMGYHRRDKDLKQLETKLK